MLCQEKLKHLWLNYKHWLLPLISGLLLNLSSPSGQTNWLIWFSLIPLLIFLIQPKTSLKYSFWAGLITGLVFFSFNLSWFFQTLPLDWVGVNNLIIGFLIVLFIWLISVVFLALFIGLFALGFQWLKTSQLWLNLLLIPSLWALLEYLRAWGFGLLWLGPSSLLGPHWTFGFLAYGLAESQNLRQLAGLGGPYLLTFLIVLVNALIFYLGLSIKKNYPFRQAKKIWSTALIFWLLILVLGSAYLTGLWLKKEQVKTSQSIQPIRLALVQTNTPSFFTQSINERAKIFMLQTKLLEQASQSRPEPQIIALPEDSRYLSIFQKTSQQTLQKLFGQKNLLLIDSGRYENQNQAQTQIVYWQNQKGVIARSDKLFLVPNGEYLPYGLSLLAKLFGQSQWVNDFEKFRTYQKGSRLTAVEFKGVKIGGLLCSAILSPELYRQLTKNNSQILFNLASEAPFHYSQKLFKQVLAMAQLRAVENNRYLVKVANAGYSYVIDSLGRVQKIAPDAKNQVINNSVLPRQNQTWYNKLGNWVVWFSWLLVFICGIIKRK